jgi:lipid A 3-O-deacylase
MRPILPAFAALVVLSGASHAADLGAAPPAFAPVRPAGILSELRLGGSAQDPWSNERGTANFNGELLLAKPTLTEDRFWSVFVPRPTLGGSFNLAGRTSYGYVGATWTVDVTERIFVEGFFGAAFHDGATGPRAFVPPRLNALGCSPLFREAAALGFRLSERWSVMATVEHMSNAGLCVENRGLTTVGAKIAYTF